MTFIRHLTALFLLIATCQITFAADGIPTIALPSIPDTLRTPQLRAAYLLHHFWDALDTNDTVSAARLLEDNFATYATLFPIVEQEEADAAAATLLTKTQTSAGIYNETLSTAEKYLAEPLSPVYNPEAFMAFLSAATTQRFTDDARLQRYDALLSTLSANRPGAQCADFTIKLKGKPDTTLRGIINGIPTLLLFHDPECEDCSALISGMRTLPSLKDAIGSGNLQIVAVDLSGDEERWAADDSHIPSEWIDAFSPDAEVLNEEIYYIPRFPSLYLINADGTVLLRDTTLEKVTEALRH